jgi:hypothetical protein
MVSSLETRYRRLLALYPRDHRAVHEEEMIGVMLAAAKPGQRRPGIRDTADLLRGAILIRLRRLPDKIRRDWSDALAIVSFLATVLLCVGIGSFAAGFLVLNIREHSGSWNSVYVALSVALLAWPTVLLLALVGLRRVSMTVAWLAAVLGALAFAGEMQEWAGLGLLAAAALTWSPGPARGVTLIGPLRMIGYLVGVAALGAVFVYAASGDVGLRPGWAAALGAWVAFWLAVLLVGGMAFRFGTAAARRASLLLALPLTAIVLAVFRYSDLWSLQQLGDVTIGTHSLLYWIETSIQIAVPAAVLLTMLIFTRRRKQRREAVPSAAANPQHKLPGAPS